MLRVDFYKNKMLNFTKRKKTDEEFGFFKEKYMFKKTGILKYGIKKLTVGMRKQVIMRLKKQLIQFQWRR